MAETRADDVVVTGVGVCCNLGDELAAIEEHLREGRGGRFAKWTTAIEVQARCQIIGRYEGDVSDAALAIPKKGLFTDDLDDDQRFVYVVTAGKEPVKRTVAAGRSNDELVEITAGLAVGEEILLEKPGTPKPTETAKASEPAKVAESPKPADAVKPAEPAQEAAPAAAAAAGGAK